MPTTDPESPKPLLLVAACALVDGDGRVLVAERPAGRPMAGSYEFPGGKLRDGETPERCLIRELKEELDIDTETSCLAPLSFVSHAYDTFHLLMPLYVCRVWRGEPRPCEGQGLRWVRPRGLRDLPLLPADLPLIPVLEELL